MPRADGCIVFLKKYGIEVKFVTSDEPSAFAAAIDEKTKAIYVESIGNPKYNISPISEIAKVCHGNLCAFVPCVRTGMPSRNLGRTRAQGPADRR